MLICSCQKEGGNEKELSEKELLEKVISGKWVREDRPDKRKLRRILFR
jgi:hypothetical protein